MQAPIPNGDGSYTWINLRDQYEWYDYFKKYSSSFQDDSLMKEYFNTVIMSIPTLRQRWESWYTEQQAYENIHNGGNPSEALQTFAEAGIEPSQAFSDWISNAMSQYNTQQQQGYEKEMRDTSVTSTGNQLASLGLSPSSVVQVGGASSGVNSSAADVMKPNAASLRQQANINRYNQQLGLAKNLISTAGSMASSGIYGAALGAVKQSARSLVTTAAHSGYAAMKATQNPNWESDWNSMMKELNKGSRSRNIKF